MKNQIPFKLFDTVKELISAITISQKNSITDAMQAIDRGALGIAFITEETSNKLVGLITDGDIRRALLSGYGLNSNAYEIPRPKATILSVNSSKEQISSALNDKIRVIPLIDDAGAVVDIAVFDERVHFPVAEPFLGEKELQYVTDCILTGWVSSSGKYVTEFEEKFADFCGTDFAISTCNGTAALHLALVAHGIHEGDEVIVPTLTFISTANAVKFTGASPVFIDSEPETWNMDPAKIEAAITPNTKMIIPVHLYGHPADMDPIMDIAKKHNLIVLEDAAEAHGAVYKGLKAGSIGHSAIFSFYGNKIITTGEGGMVVTSDKNIAELCRKLRDHGMSRTKKYWHEVLGFNYRMTNINAALGVAQMERIEDLILRKRQIAALYHDKLSKIDGITCPIEKPWAENVYWLYTILIEKEKFGYTRDELMDYLLENGIDTRPAFPPVHKQPIYQTGQYLPIADAISEKGINLPSATNLRDEEINLICEFISLKSTKKFTND